MIKANIFNIQRFSVDDGPGIRTTVFLKGCPLTCIWCHNPESNAKTPELMYIASKCIYCGACAAACEKGGHAFSENEDGKPVHVLTRVSCDVCGNCAGVCPTKALEVCGRWEDIDTILAEVESDRVFYETSGGGMTVSGGEPLYQPEATTELLCRAKKAGLHTAIETCGFASESVLRAVIPYVDLFLFDYKAEADDHERFTGVPLAPILRSLDILEETHAAVTLRCPIIPGCNDTQSHFDAIAALAVKYACIGEVHLEPYHPLGISKCEQIGKTPIYDKKEFADKKTLARKAEEISAICGKKCKVN